ncbi:MAG: tetratricopeptide repeat protein [Planctomycetota bacterium]|nr:tetratricopeptide repeat protein [Planctomycetota bacterium]
MRYILTTAFILSATVVSAQTYKVGDKVVAISSLYLRTDKGRVDAHVFPGLPLIVTAVDHKRLWVVQDVPGWLDEINVVPFDDAIDYLTERIKAEPSNTTWRYGQALVWADKGETDAAIKVYDELIELEPDTPYYYNARGASWRIKGEFDKAIADYTEAIRLDSTEPTYYRNRGATREAKGDYDKAISDYHDAIRYQPKSAVACNNIAWLMATYPDRQYRNGAKAITHATTACEITAWKDPNYIDTLAAAHAETGNFDDAIKRQKQAIELAPESEKDSYRPALELYKRHNPYRTKP